MDGNAGQQAPSGVIKKQHVRLNSNESTAPASVESKLPTVKLQQTDGIVQAIEVYCQCGSKIVIDCKYETKS